VIEDTQVHFLNKIQRFLIFKQPVYHSERFAPEKARVLDSKRRVHIVLARMTIDRRLTKVLRKGLKCLSNFEFVVEEVYRSVHIRTCTHFMLFVSWH